MMASSGFAVAMCGLSTAAFAQSTGSLDFEEEIVVTGTTTTDVAGVEIPDTSKAKQVLNQEFLSKQNPGQTVLDSINAIPGVSFQNNDGFGSAGGTLSIRGFGGDRISLTFDGVPLNDSGNYAIYSNQQLSPELIEQVNVNLGSTDVDSPTASATGGTVNYRTRKPYEDFSVRMAGSAGDFGFMRIFASVDTGNLTSSGTRAFFAAEKVDHRNVYGVGKIDKTQVNARVYQPIGDNGDFVSVSGNYNENRNNFFGSVSLASFPTTKDARFANITRCQVAAARPGIRDVSNRCGSAFDYRVNPSNTGNIRGASRFTLSDGLVLSIDPSYQYVKANGGGTTRGNEGSRNGFYGYIGGQPYAGVDLNGDGDLLDQVEILQPSQTQTHRYGVISSLRYDINDQHTVRINYTYDNARHRQTGQIGLLNTDGFAIDPFPVNDPILDVTGTPLTKRDRLSYAILHQVSGEYRGELLDDRLMVNIGVRAPFFTRELNQYCFTTSASGFVDCFGKDDSQNAAYAAANPTYAPPQSRTYKYDKILPNLGFRFRLTDDLSTYGSYAKGLSVPGTDPLYDSLFFADSPSVRPVPETTDSFDLGLRYTSGRVQAQVAAWFSKFENRLARSYDPVLDQTIYRNLGTVDKYGLDGSIAFAVNDNLRLYVFGSLSESEIKENVQTGVVAGSPVFAATAGKQESGSPTNSYGGAFDINAGPVSFGALAKYTGKRFVNDINTREVDGYWLVNLNARVGLEWVGLNDKTYLQFNMYNAFDELFVGGFGGDLTSTSPFVQVGAPRTFTASVNFQF
ncbi:TonB-dependent receptor [Sphingorhabdus lutea]|uniref:TonB-dependent receptor n=2 Tax=Sphingorhabdus lutea TaxID=1913578 RepID=A0A1L3JF04_9SPHN|nr:TonB-dependent receptor [Sphingorhabdus lutea]